MQQERLEAEERDKRLAAEALERQLRPRRRRQRPKEKLEEQSQLTFMQNLKAKLGYIAVFLTAVALLLSLAIGLGFFNY